MTIRFYTTEDLSPRQALTSEGFLLCKDVALARTGAMYYAAGEVPVTADHSGLIIIHRDTEAVFADTAINSFNGKPVTNDHPPEKVDPSNWKDYSVGVVLNPHQGSGSLSADLLYADLLITDEKAIKDVRDGKREVSAGYDAEYEQIKPGLGRQHLIVGNHVALVDKGRCGPRCAIGDKAMAVKAKIRKNSWADRILKAARAHDEGTLVEELEKIGTMMGEVLSGDADPDPDDDDKDDKHTTNVTVNHVPVPVDDSARQLGFRVDALEKHVMTLQDALIAKTIDKEELEDEDEDGPNKERKKATEDARKRKAAKDAAKAARDQVVKVKDEDEDDETDDRAMVGDSAGLQAQFHDVISKAELLAPGIKAATFDAAKPPKVTLDAMCAFRRKALREAMSEDDTKDVITAMAGPSPSIANMSCDSVAVLFNGAAEMVRKTRRPRQNSASHDSNRSSGNLLADINARNKAFYSNSR